VSALVALLGKRDLRGRLAYSAYLMMGCIGTVVAGSWVMRLIEM
jgi:hypothetical protein